MGLFIHIVNNRIREKIKGEGKLVPAQVVYVKRDAEASRRKPSRRERFKNSFKNFGEKLIRWFDERIVNKDPIIEWVVERPSGSIFKSLTENFIGIIAASLIAGIVGGVIGLFVAGL